jgi:hypothetical protein
MTAYLIKLKGCDDSTEFGMDLSDDEAALVQRVSEASREASEFDCMPTLLITAAGTSEAAKRRGPSRTLDPDNDHRFDMAGVDGYEL